MAGPWQNGSNQPIVDETGAIIECADNPCDPCGVPDGCHYAIVICNANAQVDDEFAVLFNGRVIGGFDGGVAGCPAAVYVTNSAIAVADIPMSDCCEDGAIKTTIPASYFRATANRLRLVNVGINGNNNWGTVQFWRLLYSDGVVVYRNLCFSDVYAGDDGESFTFFFDACDCEIPPCCETEGGGPTAIIGVTETGPCGWTLTSESTAGTCGTIESCEWTYHIYEDNDEGDTEPITYSGCTLEFSPELYCGARQIVAYLKVTDTEGCESVASVTLDCAECEPTFDLSATLLSENEDGTCTYQICASIIGGSEEECGGNGAFINIIIEGGCPADSCNDCQDLGTGGCCGFNLRDGDCIEVTITGSDSIHGIPWTRLCGCSGDPIVLILPCDSCDCCEDTTGAIESASITLGGIADGSGEVCTECESINGLYIVPAEGCAGADEFDINPGCIEGFETPTLNITWQLLCDDPDFVTLRVDVTLAEGVPSATFQETVARPGPNEPVDCSLLGSALVRTGCVCGGTAQFRCDFNSITASLEFNML